MKFGRTLAFSVVSILVMGSSLLAFSFILLKEFEYYNFKNYVVQPVVFMSIIYGFYVFLLAGFFKSKRILLLSVFIGFTTVYLFMNFQIAFEARSEFGATWLSSEVFWELFVYKGKALFTYVVGLMLSTISTIMLSRKAKSKEFQQKSLK
ncbi:MAG: hypothetical protein AB8B59_11280 [Maribacter sp.]